MMAVPTDYRTLSIKLRAQLAAMSQEPCGAAGLPRVLTPELQQKLQLVNAMARWLRQNGHAPLMVDLSGERPTVHVDRSAASFLSRAGHGMTIKGKGANRYGYVLVDGCEIRWAERVN